MSYTQNLYPVSTAIPIQVTSVPTIDHDDDNMQLPSNVRVLCSRLQTILRQRRRKQQKRSLEISAPFNFTHQPVIIPGISEDEISILREKAAASRIGIAEMMPQSPSSLNSHPPMIVRRARSATAMPLMI
ncbi:hypothetical protein NLU13_0510 [Sarocladium strictum]|uniref:Uncharacterized protein n=1 Tax=Sarocladium strictum TaxID=5046 RepID=A0AA39LBC4_SARSR|nr:hypothetical protein NLU13_0510 [Sarocladium strictum]